jgi:lipid-binding SYLF domain-containing protein
MRATKILFTLAAALALLALPAPAQDKEQERIRESGVVMKEILGVPENIPQELLDKAECVAVIPATKTGALGFGGSYGRGVVTCRAGENFTGPWSAPSMIALESVSFGLQLGGKETDYVLLIMSPKGADSVLKTEMKLGADASVAAGPKGRTASAATDIAMRAEILTYSRTRGLFAGVSIEGGTLRIDESANEKIYGKGAGGRQIVRRGMFKPPGAAGDLLAALNGKSPRNYSDHISSN